MKGNVIDLAVAVIVGGAFGPVITTLVDALTPGGQQDPGTQRDTPSV